jgi:hypothetical protein
MKKGFKKPFFIVEEFPSRVIVSLIAKKNARKKMQAFIINI